MSSPSEQGPCLAGVELKREEIGLEAPADEALPDEDLPIRSSQDLTNYESDSNDNLVIDTSVSPAKPTKAKSSSRKLTNGNVKQNGTAMQPPPQPTDAPTGSAAELIDLTPNQINWHDLSGTACRVLTRYDYDRYIVPFQQGWRREVVLRAVPTAGGKRIGDIYYFSADRKVKLRSNTDTTAYFSKLKDPDNTLSLDNFTFMRQPIYQEPEEIVRHAQPRYGVVAYADPSTDPLNSSVASLSESESLANSQGGDGDGSVVETGRGKRKRVAPKRFEDEEEELPSPVKKLKAPKATKVQATPPATAVIFPGVTGVAEEPVESTADEPTTSTPKVQIIKSGSGGPKIIRTPATLSSSAKKGGIKLNQQAGKLNPLKSNQLKIRKISPSISTKIKSESSKFDESRLLARKISSAERSVSLEADQSANNSVANESIITSPQQQSSPPPFSGAEEPAKIISRTGSTSSLSDLKGGEQFNSNLMVNMDSLPPSDDEALLNEPTKDLTAQTKLKQEDDRDEDEEDLLKIAEEGSDVIGNSVPAPCSVHCASQKGMAPNLLCCRCLCFFHMDCVPTGIFLSNPHRFLCPTCKQGSEETEATMLTNGFGGTEDEEVRLMNGGNMAAATSSNYSIVHGNLGSAPASRPSSHKSASNKLSIKKAKHRPNKSLVNGCSPMVNGFSSSDHHSHQQSSATSVKEVHQKSGASINDRSRSLLDRFQTLSANRMQSVFGGNLNPSLRHFIKPIEPIGPPQLSSSQLASIMTKLSKKSGRRGSTSGSVGSHGNGPNSRSDSRNSNRFEDWLRKQEHSLDTVTDHRRISSAILSYLTAADLVNLRLVNRKFHLLCSTSSLWRNLVLRDCHVSEWPGLGENVIERYQSEAVSFEGLNPLRLTATEFWRYFDSLVPFCHSVRVMKFSAVPSSAIQSLITAMGTSRGSIPLKELAIRNVFDADDRSRTVSFDFLTSISNLAGLERLTINSMRGISFDAVMEQEMDTDDVDQQQQLQQQLSLANVIRLATDLPQLASLRHLSLPNLSISEPEHFLQLLAAIATLPELTSLELGSCRSWTTPVQSADDVLDEDDESGPLSTPELMFPLLERMTRLTHLYLSGLFLVDSEAVVYFTSALSKLVNLESLNLDKLAIAPRCGLATAHFIGSLHPATLPALKRLTLFTDGPISNAAILSSLPLLNGLREITWRVGCFVQDTGECFVVLGDLGSSSGGSLGGGQPVKAHLSPFHDIERELVSKLDRTWLRVLPS